MNSKFTFAILFSSVLALSACDSAHSDHSGHSDKKEHTEHKEHSDHKSGSDHKTDSDHKHHEAKADAISINHARIRALPPGLKVTAMYFKVDNGTAKDNALVKVEGDISQQIELHTHTNDNGVMKMGQVKSIPVSANGSVEAKQGSYHVMIMGLQKDPKLGEKFDFTFTFEDGTSLPVTAEVQKMGESSHGSHGSSHGDAHKGHGDKHGDKEEANPHAHH